MVRKDPGPRSQVRFIGRVIQGSRPGPHPGFVEPALATLKTKPPTGADYRDITADGLLRHVTFRGLYSTRTAKKPLVTKFAKLDAAN